MVKDKTKDKDNIMSPFKSNITTNYSKPTRANNVYGGRKKPRKSKIKNQVKDNIISM